MDRAIGRPLLAAVVGLLLVTLITAAAQATG
jgi:hypothetical protein